MVSSILKDCTLTLAVPAFVITLNPIGQKPAFHFSLRHQQAFAGQQERSSSYRISLKTVFVFTPDMRTAHGIIDPLSSSRPQMDCKATSGDVRPAAKMVFAEKPRHRM